jgi:hypothetical protein
MVRVGGHPFETVQENFLQRLHILILAADSNVSTATPILSLLTLIAEHFTVSSESNAFQQIEHQNHLKRIFTSPFRQAATKRGYKDPISETRDCLGQKLETKANRPAKGLVAAGRSNRSEIAGSPHWNCKAVNRRSRQRFAPPAPSTHPGVS